MSTVFDWRAPDYTAVLEDRLRRLERMRATPGAAGALHAYYRDHIAQFITDWGCTFDPRNVDQGVPSLIPFVLFPKQEECVRWIIDRWRGQESGLIEKSRDSGLSWLAVATAVSLCLFHSGIVIGFGSRKEDYIDRAGDPKSLFWKARIFAQHLPGEFLGGFDATRHAPHMRITFPGTGSTITGEAGDNIGRGDRTSIYFVDEAAFLERPQLIDASLSATTRTRIDISTPNGLANPFAERRRSGRWPVFTLHWRDDPRKGPEWYAKQMRDLDPVTLAQEVDISYSASAEGILIPAAWVQAAIGAHEKLLLEPSGGRYFGFDVADEGRDLNAVAARHGFLLEFVHAWSGQGSDIFRTTCTAFGFADELGYECIHYDADGLGAGVRGDAAVINAERAAAGKPAIRVEPFRGSGAVWRPDGSMVKGRLNRDFFANAKAQAWWALRLRFQATYRAIVEGIPCDPDEIISVRRDFPELSALAMELSQPTYSINSAGKILIDKSPDGTQSPNRADAVMIAYEPSGRAFEIWERLGRQDEEYSKFRGVSLAHS